MEHRDWDFPQGHHNWDFLLNHPTPDFRPRLEPRKHDFRLTLSTGPHKKLALESHRHKFWTEPRSATDFVAEGEILRHQG